MRMFSQRDIFLALMTPSSFEPTGWAILRGATAVYSCITLLAFSIFLGWSQVMNYTKAGFTVQETLLPASQYDQVHDAGLFFGYVTTASVIRAGSQNIQSSQYQGLLGP